ncbi:MAG: sugar ABC transporter substrate-binding protein [Oscillospiraceae bacterium]|nr:sugar ABC transporter substrate-binding protein [Oscillospiraceae bacterium]
MKKFLAILLAVAMLATLFAGCGSKEAEKVTITMVESLTSPERTATIQGIIDKYEAENPNVHIELISPPLENADAKISQMLMNGEADIIEVRDQTIAQYVNNEWLADLDPYVAEWEHKDTLSEDSWTSMHQLDGKCYLVPSGFYQRCLYYREDVLADAGVAVPTTWQELLEASQTLTDAGSNFFGYSFRGGSSGYQYIDTIYWSYIGVDKLADPNAGYYLKDGNGATIFTLPECKEALAYYKELFQASPSDSIAWAFSEMVEGFIGGTTAFLIQDAEVIANCSVDMEEGTWNTAPFPIGPSGEAVFPNGFGGWGMAADCENKDAAAAFLLYLSNPENNATYAANHAMVPIHTNASDFSDAFSDGYFACYSEMAGQPAVYRHATEPQMYVAFATFKTEADAMYQKFLLDEITDDELLQWLDEFWIEAYETEGQLW